MQAHFFTYQLWVTGMKQTKCACSRVWREFGGGSRLNEGKIMSNDRMTIVPSPLVELDTKMLINYLYSIRYRLH